MTRTPYEMQRAAVLPRARSLSRPPRRFLWVAVAATLLALGFLWFRDSAFVRVERVTVSGLTGPDAARIRAALTDTARDMTTLHLREGQLRTVLEPYPVIKDISLQRDFPHGVRIIVRQNVPVAEVMAQGVRTPVARNGMLLPDAARRPLADVPLKVVAGGGRVTDQDALRAIAVLAAAPSTLRARVQTARWTGDGGITLDLRSGPQLRFGAADRLAAKWASAAAVLADPASAGASYIDVRYPERPAAGGLEDPATQLDPTAANAASAPNQTGTETQVTP